MSASLTVRAITAREEWSRLRPVWNDLLLRSPSPTVFLTYEWLSTWWDCLAGPSSSLLILVVEREGDIVAVAPMMKVLTHVLGIPMRKVRFISTMKRASHPSTISSNLDIIAPSGEDEAVRAVFAHLRCRESEWDYLQLLPIPDESPTLRCFDKSGNNELPRFLVQPALHTSIVRIECSWSEYVRGHGREVKKAMKRAEDTNGKGADGLRVIECRSLQEVPGGFETLLDIERHSWKWTKGVSLNSAVFGNFYPKLAENLSGTGMLHIHVLEIEGRPVAYNYSAQFGDAIWGQKLGFDDAYRKHGPGKILVYHLLRIAHEKSLAWVDLGWGDAQYKSSITKDQQHRSELIVFADTLRGRMAQSYFGSPPLRRTVDHMSDGARRLARHLGIHLASSELTRQDQLRRGGMKEKLS
jgi:hypothetical protein